jgi:hypothetical protein
MCGDILGSMQRSPDMKVLEGNLEIRQYPFRVLSVGIYTVKEPLTGGFNCSMTFHGY